MKAGASAILDVAFVAAADYPFVHEVGVEVTCEDGALWIWLSSCGGDFEADSCVGGEEILRVMRASDNAFTRAIVRTTRRAASNLKARIFRLGAR